MSEVNAEEIKAAQRFFSREGPAQSGPIDDYHGCGNSLVRRAALPDPNRPFDAVRNRTGGEDDLLFGGMKTAGARFAWAADAWVWEDPAPERLTLLYAMKRAYAYGQGPCADSAAGKRPLGVAQTAVYGAMAAVKWAVRSPDRAYALDRVARGFGKILWFPPFKFKFYGQAT